MKQLFILLAVLTASSISLSAQYDNGWAYVEPGISCNVADIREIDNNTVEVWQRIDSNKQNNYELRNHYQFNTKLNKLRLLASNTYNKSGKAQGAEVIDYTDTNIWEEIVPGTTSDKMLKAIKAVSYLKKVHSAINLGKNDIRWNSFLDVVISALHTPTSDISKETIANTYLLYSNEVKPQNVNLEEFYQNIGGNVW